MPNHGGDKGSTKYAPLDQINRNNVRNLRIVWRRPAVADELRPQHPNLSFSNSVDLYMGLVEEQLDPVAKSGSISLDFARRAIEIKYLLGIVLPFKDTAVEVFTKVLVFNEREKPDIWSRRNISLDGSSNLIPVAVGVWDTGIDISLFRGQMLHNEDGGIAWTWNGERTEGLLPKIPVSQEIFLRSKRFTKGSNDMRADIDSTEASALRRHLVSLAKHQVKSFLEGLQCYSDYAHGTHVAGVLAQGNPAIRMVVARMEWPYQIIWPVPTRTWAESRANVMQQTIGYFRSFGVRVVNISWGDNPRQIERGLDGNAKDHTPGERQALAHQFFQVISQSLKDAIKSAPEILFVAAAGNLDSSVQFVEEIPSSFDLINVLSVGAVDGAGEETPFTSFGKVDIYANGHQIESVIPGGERQSWSGTSMAAPQVANLAAKLLAKYPNLSTDELRVLILNGADAKQILGERTIRLLNPKRSFELALGRSSPR